MINMTKVIYLDPYMTQFIDLGKSEWNQSQVIGDHTYSMRMLSSPVNVFLMIRFSGANSNKEGAPPVIVFTLPHKNKNKIPGVFSSLVALTTFVSVWALISCSYYLLTSSGSDGRVKIASSFFPVNWLQLKSDGPASPFEHSMLLGSKSLNIVYDVIIDSYITSK